MTTIGQRRKLGPMPKRPELQRGRMSGDAYMALLKFMGLSHAEMAEALGTSKWCSVAWRSGRRNIPKLAEVALSGLLLRRLAGDIAAKEADRILQECRNRG